MSEGGRPGDPLAQTRHDLRNHVNQILGYAELLQEESEDAGQQAFVPTLQKIQLAARRQLELIDGLRGLPAPDAAIDAATAAAPRREAAPVPDAGEAPAAEPASGSLLVVDDNEMNRDMLSRRLRQRGYAVDAAEDGATALQVLAERRHELVILDVMMPGISGLEVLVRLRAGRSASDLPVIMATARDASEDVVEALRLGANDYVTKPLDFPVVLARVQTQLALKRQSDRIRQLAQDLDLRNRFIQNTFGRFLSDEVVRGLLESPEGLKLGGESRKVTILMSDLRGFTALSEHLGPVQVVRILNRYLGAMAEVILAHRGTIDEFIGDAILAIFGAPVSRADDARRALACAASMQRAMSEVNRLNLLDGLPPLEMGIAVHTGEVVVGNIGSEKRTKYGVVGPPVNLAGRIESYTVGGQVLVSQATVEEAAGAALVGESVLVKAKGAREPVVAWDLRGVAGESPVEVPERVHALVDLPRPLRVRITPLEGKRLGEQSFEGAIEAAGDGAARLRCEALLTPLSDVLLTAGEDGAAGPAPEAYAKVLRVDRAAGTALLRFTSLPAAMAARLRC